MKGETLWTNEKFDSFYWIEWCLTRDFGRVLPLNAPFTTTTAWGEGSGVDQVGWSRYDRTLWQNQFCLHPRNLTWQWENPPFESMYFLFFKNGDFSNVMLVLIRGVDTKKRPYFFKESSFWFVGFRGCIQMGGPSSKTGHQSPCHHWLFWAPWRLKCCKVCSQTLGVALSNSSSYHYTNKSISVQLKMFVLGPDCM